MELGNCEKKYCCMWCLSKFDKIPNKGICPICSHKEIKEFDLRLCNKHNIAVVKIKGEKVLNNMRNGSLWFQSPKYYQEYSGKGKEAIGDESEGIDEFNRTDINLYRLMSFYSLQIDENGEDIIETPSMKLKGFGDYFILVDYKGLVKELKGYFENKNISMEYNSFIKYSFKDSYSNFNATFKHNSYSYQNELRILLKSNEFLQLGEKEPYITDKSTLDISKYFSEPSPIDKLLNAKKLDDIF